jgi:hypothetical protein
MPLSQWLWQFKTFTDKPDVRLVVQSAQLLASLLFIVLYVWSTYTPALPGSPRHQLDLLLCLVFACDYVFRIAVSTLLANLCFCLYTSPRLHHQPTVIPAAQHCSRDCDGSHPTREDSRCR